MSAARINKKRVRARKIRARTAVHYDMDMPLRVLRKKIHALRGDNETKFEETFGGVKFQGKKKEILRKIDRLISKHGAHAPLRVITEKEQQSPDAGNSTNQQGEKREKNTDAVNEEAGNLPSDDESQVHGGDGNSSETESQAETSSEEHREGQTASPGASDAPDEQVGQQSEGEADSSDTSSQEDDTNSQQADSEATAKSETGQATAPNPASGKDVSGSGTDEHQSLKDNAEKSASGHGHAAQEPSRKVTLSASPATAQAGDEAVRRKVNIRDGRRFANALRRIVNDYTVSTRGEKSPRIDSRALIREFVTKRVSLANARRQEQEIKPVLIMADVSGSCSAVSGDTLAASLSIQEAMPDVVQVVVHSNGYPVDMQGNHLPESIHIYDEKEADALAEWYTSQNWSLVINLGDWDAGDVLLAISKQGSEILWLDSFAASHRVAYYSKDNKQEFPHWPSKVTKVDGVGDVITALAGLKIYERKK